MTLGSAEVLEEVEVRALLETFSRAPTAIRNRALVMLLWRTGLRVSEALALFPSHLRLDDRPTLRIAHSKTPSGHRVVGIHHEAVAALEPWMVLRTGLGATSFSPVFCTLRGDSIDPSYVRHVLRRKRHQAGIIKRVHPHAFRATLAVELAREGVPLPAIRDVLGHANVAQTDAYLRRVFPADAIDAVLDRRVA